MNEETKKLEKTKTFGFHKNVEAGISDHKLRDKPILFILISYFIIFYALVFLFVGASVFGRYDDQMYQALSLILIAVILLVFYKRFVKLDNFARYIYVGVAFFSLLFPIYQHILYLFYLLPFMIVVVVVYKIRDNKVFKNTSIFFATISALIFIIFLDQILYLMPGLLIIYTLLFHDETIALFDPTRVKSTKEYQKVTY